MDTKLKMELYKAAALTFEELCFCFPTPDLDEEQRNAQSDATVKVEFTGPFHGQLVLTICGNVLPILTANMLGEEEITQVVQQHDALGEMANIICGNVLPAIAGSTNVFQISSPQILNTTAEGMRSGRPPTAVVQIGLDQGRADLRLFIDS